MTMQIKITELNENTDKILKVLDEILDILGSTKLVVQFQTLTDEAEVASITYFKGQSFGKLPTPYRDDYDFAGWYTYYAEYNGKQIYRYEIENYSEVTSQGKITLYAKWLPIQRKIIFHPGTDGHVNPASALLRLDEKFSDMRNGEGLPIPNWAGKEHNGKWNTITGGEITNDSQFVSSMLDSNGECPLTAQWTDYSFKLSVYYNYGEFQNSSRTPGPISAEFKVYANTIYNVLETFASNLDNTSKYNVKGHTFIGLAYTKNCQDIDETESSITVFDNTVLYAAWQPNTYKLHYYLNLGGTTRLLSTQTMKAENVEDLISIRNLVEEPLWQQFNCWSRDTAHESGVDNRYIDMIDGAFDEKPVCNLVGEPDGSASVIFNLSPSPITNVQVGNSLPADQDHGYAAWDGDWAMVTRLQNAIEPDYFQGDEIQLAAYRMFLFSCKKEPDPSWKRTYSIQQVIPTYTDITELAAGTNNVRFQYGTHANAFWATYNIYAKPTVNSIRFDFLLNNFKTSYKYGDRLNVSKLSVLETAYNTGSGGDVDVTTFTHTQANGKLSFSPATALTERLTTDFRFTITCRSKLSSSGSSSKTVQIYVANATAGLSAILPEGGLHPLPANMPFKKNVYLSGLSACGILENGTPDSNRDTWCGIDLLSVMNLTETQPGGIPIDCGVLNICSCRTNGTTVTPYPSISCRLPVETVECGYTFDITQNPIKTLYQTTDISADLSGLSGILNCGTRYYPAIASCEVTDLSCFNDHGFSNFNSTNGIVNIPVQCTFKFTDSADGTFPNWPPYTDGYIGTADFTVSASVITDVELMYINLSCPESTTDYSLNFGRLIPKYNSVTYEMVFSDDGTISTMTGRSLIHTFRANQSYTISVRTNKSIQKFAGGEISNSIYCSANVQNTNDFAYYVDSISSIFVPAKMFAGINSTIGKKEITLHGMGTAGNHMVICENAFDSNAAIERINLAGEFKNFTIKNAAFNNCYKFTGFNLDERDRIISRVFSEYETKYAANKAKWNAVFDRLSAIAAAKMEDPAISGTINKINAYFKNKSVTVNSICDIIDANENISSYVATKSGILYYPKSGLDSPADEIANNINNNNINFGGLNVVGVFPESNGIQNEYGIAILSSGKITVLDGIKTNDKYVYHTSFDGWTKGISANVLSGARIIANYEFGNLSSTDAAKCDITRKNRLQIMNEIDQIDFSNMIKAEGRPGFYTKMVEESGKQPAVFSQNTAILDLDLERNVFKKITDDSPITINSGSTSYGGLFEFKIVDFPEMPAISASLKYGYSLISGDNAKIQNNTITRNDIHCYISSIGTVNTIKFPANYEYLSNRIAKRITIDPTKFIGIGDTEPLSGQPWSKLRDVKLSQKIRFEFSIPGLSAAATQPISSSNADWKFSIHSYTLAEDLTFPDAEMSIESDAFAGTKIRAIDLESYINKNRQIPANAFANMNNLQILDFKATNNTILSSIEQNAYKNCNNLQIINKFSSMPITTIKTAAFLSCGLKDLNLPKTLKNIGINAFTNCNSIISVRIPQAVSNINDYAFSDCEKLSAAYIELPPYIGEKEKISCGTNIFINNIHDNDSPSDGDKSQLSVIFVDSADSTNASTLGMLFNDVAVLTGNIDSGFGVGKYLSASGWDYSVQTAADVHLLQGVVV